MRVLVAHSPRHLQWSVWVGTLGALWSASTGAKALPAGVDHMHETARRPFLRFQAAGFAMTLASVAEAQLAAAIMLALPNVLGFLGFSRRARGLVHTLSFVVLVCAAVDVEMQPHLWPCAALSNRCGYSRG